MIYDHFLSSPAKVHYTIFQLKYYIKFVILNGVKNLLLISDRFFAIAQNDIFELAITITTRILIKFHEKVIFLLFAVIILSSQASNILRGKIWEQKYANGR